MFGEPNIEYLAEALKQVVRVGVVTNTYPDKATVRVKCSDADGLVTWPLRVLAHKTHKDKAYWMPDIGEHVLCVFLPYGHEQGFVIGALYSDQDQVPVADQDKAHTLFDDGSRFEYDRKTHRAVLDMTAPSGSMVIRTGTTEIVVQPDHVFIRSDRIDLNDDR